MKHIGLEMEVSMGQWTNKLSAAVLYPILVAFVKETPLDCFGHAQLDSHIRSDPYITWSSTANVLAVLVCLPGQLCWCACTWCAGVFTRGQSWPVMLVCLYLVCLMFWCVYQRPSMPRWWDWGFEWIKSCTDRMCNIICTCTIWRLSEEIQDKPARLRFCTNTESVRRQWCLEDTR